MAELISYLPLLIIGLFFYGIYESFASSHHIEKLAKEYCEKNNYQFVEVKSAKAHMSIVYKEKGSNKRIYKKFHVRTSLGRVKKIIWL